MPALCLVIFAEKLNVHQIKDFLISISQRFEVFWADSTNSIDLNNLDWKQTQLVTKKVFIVNESENKVNIFVDSNNTIIWPGYINVCIDFPDSIVKKINCEYPYIFFGTSSLIGSEGDWKLNA